MNGENDYIKILREARELAMRPDFLDFIFKELDREIKGDYPAKAGSFFTAASSYINPINTLFGMILGMQNLLMRMGKK